MTHNDDGNAGPKFLPNGQNYGPREKAGPNLYNCQTLVFSN